MKFKVGQEWVTRDGRVATIKEVREKEEGLDYPVFAQIGEEDPYRWSFTKDGSTWITGAKDERDLIRLVSDSEGWIEWCGGENPVPGATVEYQMRDDDTSECDANLLRWGHDDTSGDILAYKVMKAAPEPELKPEPFTITEPGEYVTRDGRKVFVVAVNLRWECPVLGYIVEGEWDNACTWCADGRVYTHDTDNPRDIVGRWSPWANLALDTPVWVKDKHDAEWVARHFAGVLRTGKPTTWINGLTSHSASTGVSTTSWDEMSLTKPE